MARYRNQRTGDVVDDDGDLGLAHIDAWVEVDEVVKPNPTPAEAQTSPTARPRKAAAPK